MKKSQAILGRPSNLRSGLGTIAVAVSCAGALLNGTGCSDSGSSTGVDGGPPTVQTAGLCDGTETVRLVYANVGGGPLPGEFEFYGAYGHEFFAVDGQCRYWAGDNYLKGIKTGTLAAAQASDLTTRLHYKEFAALQGSPSGRDGNETGCPDATTQILSAGGNKLTCSCGCSGSSTAKKEAFKNVSGIVQDLLSAGVPTTGPLRVLTVPESQKTGASTMAVLWPLAWSPAEAVLGAEARVTADSGRLVTAETDLSALRSLRAAAAAKPTYGGLVVDDGSGALFRVYPRDELPVPVAQAVLGVAR